MPRGAAAVLMVAAGAPPSGRITSMTTGMGTRTEIGFKTPFTLAVVLAGTVKVAESLLRVGRSVPGPKAKGVACVSARMVGLRAPRMKVMMAAVTALLRNLRDILISFLLLKKMCSRFCLLLDD
jgi:ribose/xylose/arabinose/galactoside ABC-type transport system permease subunit